MIFWEIAKRNIRIHMLRSTLAMLGIVIGVVAIASMGILGNSMVATVSESLSSILLQNKRINLFVIDKLKYHS